MSRVALVGLLAGLMLGGCSDSSDIPWFGSSENTVTGPAGQELTVSVPRSVTIHRGQTKPVEIGLDRKGFSGPVRATISQLPAGVRAADAEMKVETNAATFILTASQDAALVANQSVRVTAEGPDGMAATQYFKLTVKQ